MWGPFSEGDMFPQQEMWDPFYEGNMFPQQAQQNGRCSVLFKIDSLFLELLPQ